MWNSYVATLRLDRNPWRFHCKWQHLPNLDGGWCLKQRLTWHAVNEKACLILVMYRIVVIVIFHLNIVCSWSKTQLKTRSFAICWANVSKIKHLRQLQLHIWRAGLALNQDFRILGRKIDANYIFADSYHGAGDLRLVSKTKWQINLEMFSTLSIDTGNKWKPKLKTGDTHPGI